MKKMIIILGLVLVIAVGGFIIFQNTIRKTILDYKYKDSYCLYTKITGKGTRTSEGNDEFNNYLYDTIGYDEKGNELKLSFYGMDGKELKIGTYLKVYYSDDREVISWKSIDKKEIPKKIVEKLE